LEYSLEYSFFQKVDFFLRIFGLKIALILPS
jgi:hypothetical protein